MAGRKRKNELNYPPYILNALAAMKPPERLTVSQWADRYRVLSEIDSASPGKFRTAQTPYLREVMDAVNENWAQDLTLCGGAQIGKTTLEQNIIGYCVAQDPGPMLIVYPTKDLAKFYSEKRLQPLFRLSPALAELYDERHSKDLELTFPSMYIALTGANSAADLSSRPVRYVIFDEIDKFPKWTGEEAGPLELAEERTKTFYNKKIIKVSTPTLKTGNIWQGWLNADVRKKYYVPCPECGEYQTLEFKQIKWPQDADSNQAREMAQYECKFCKARIDSRKKPEMLRGGEWRAISTTKGKPRKLAYHLNSIYSPWLTFGDVAAKFLECKDEPSLLMNFINSWLAEPWEDKSSRLKSDVVMTKALPYDKGRMPPTAQLLTVGVDVQLDHFYYSVRAWGPHMTSWLVDWGKVYTWPDIETVIYRDYADMNGEIHNVNLACIDSGYNTDEVYAFCAHHMEVAVPTKGASRPLKTRYTSSILDKSQVGFGLLLYEMDTNQMKNFIASRMGIDPGAPGSWNVYRDIEREYADQICSEQRVEKKDKKGRTSIVWEKIGSHTANHLLDCETNNVLAAEKLGVRFLIESQPEEPEDEEPEDDWLGVGKDWI